MTKAFETVNNCTVKYQGFTDYAGDVSTMMSTSEYGDVLMIPDTVKLSDLSDYFEPLGTYDDLKEKYNWADQKMYDGVVYGISHLGSVSGGICYNKKVWADAGITILIKLIDAKDNLSVQVHPNNEYALRVEGEYGKTEMWYVIDADEGSELLYGFKRRITREEFTERIL